LELLPSLNPTAELERPAGGGCLCWMIHYLLT
jgi:hypothetical protein